VRNLTTDSLEVKRSTYLKNTDMYPFFDGLGVKVFNDSIFYQPEKSGLSSGQSDYKLKVTADTIQGLSARYPADYTIVFSSGIVAKSRGSEIGLPEIPVNFTLHNQTEDMNADFLFYDYDSDGMVTAGDEIVPLIPDDSGTGPVDFRTTWRIKFIAPPGSNLPPQPGDVFTVSVSKPFRTGDQFEFETFRAPGINRKRAKSDLDRVKVVPNPYVVTNPLEPKNKFESGRGKRVLLFTHLPQKCTIRIFTMRGQLIRTLHHDSSIDDGVEKWDLVSRDGIDIAFGVYIFHIEAPGIGNKIGRFAIIK